MMNKTQTDKQFDLIVEDFYDDYEIAAEYPRSRKSSSDVLSRKLALAIVVAMVAIFAFAYIIQNPITIPAAIVVTVAVVVYRNMAKDYAKKSNA
jgi:4-hydroxybenzoate polyprenyltransferase